MEFKLSFEIECDDISHFKQLKPCIYKVNETKPPPQYKHKIDPKKKKNEKKINYGY